VVVQKVTYMIRVNFQLLLTVNQDMFVFKPQRVLGFAN